MSATKKQRLCQYGDCDSKDSPIVITGTEYGRPAFCSMLHGALWLINWERTRARNAGAYEQASEIATAEASLESVDRERQRQESEAQL